MRRKESQSFIVSAFALFVLFLLASGNYASSSRSSSTSAAVLDLDDNTFDGAIENSGWPLAFVLFTASWCSTSAQMRALLERVAHEHIANEQIAAGGTPALFANVDVESSPSVASSYGITHVPTLLAFKSQSAALFDTFAGSVSDHDLREFVTKRTLGAVSFVQSEQDALFARSSPGRPLAIAVLSSDTQRSSYHAAALELDGVDYAEVDLLAGRSTSSNGDASSAAEDAPSVIRRAAGFQPGITVLPEDDAEHGSSPSSFSPDAWVDSLRALAPFSSHMDWLRGEEQLQDVDTVLDYIANRAQPVVQSFDRAIDQGAHDGGNRLLALLLPPTSTQEDHEHAGFNKSEEISRSNEESLAQEAFENACRHLRGSFTCASSRNADTFAAFGFGDVDVDNPQIVATESGGTLKYALHGADDGTREIEWNTFMNDSYESDHNESLVSSNSIISFARRIESGDEPPLIISDIDSPLKDQNTVTALELDELLTEGSEEVLLAVLDSTESNGSMSDECKESSCLLNRTLMRVRGSLDSSVRVLRMDGARNEHPRAPSKQLPAIHFFTKSRERFELPEDTMRSTQELYDLVVSNCEACFSNTDTSKPDLFYMPHRFSSSHRQRGVDHDSRVDNGVEQSKPDDSQDEL